MKHILLALATSVLTALTGIDSAAQNLQLHYDFGKHIYKAEENRQNVTATYELTRHDGLGYWYCFVDMDFGKRGVQSAYTEVFREFNFGPESKWAGHIEYNGGLAVGDNNSWGSRYQQAALAGISYNRTSEDGRKYFSVIALYKQYFKGADNHRAYASAQLTGAWGIRFANDRLTFGGFIDFWRKEKSNNHGSLVILTEPQLWYNFNSHISAGTEVELSYNYINNQYNGNKLFANPTLALRYNF